MNVTLESLTLIRVFYYNRENDRKRNQMILSPGQTIKSINVLDNSINIIAVRNANFYRLTIVSNSINIANEEINFSDFCDQKILSVAHSKNVLIIKTYDNLILRIVLNND